MMRYSKHIFPLLAMTLALPMVTACNDDDNSVDYTEYYDWRDRNNEVTVQMWNAYDKDKAQTYFSETVASLKEPDSYPTFVHYFRHANVDSLAQLSPRKDYRPFLTSTLKVHYTLFDTKSVYKKMDALLATNGGGGSILSGSLTADHMQELLRNRGGMIDSIFFANAMDNTLKADTLESSQVKYFENFTPNTVITGWGDVLQQMYIGDNVVVMIPWFLAYGQAGSGANIDPYTNLFFRIELCDIPHWGANVPK